MLTCFISSEVTSRERGASFLSVVCEAHGKQEQCEAVSGDGASVSSLCAWQVGCGQQATLDLALL